MPRTLLSLALLAAFVALAHYLWGLTSLLQPWRTMSPAQALGFALLLLCSYLTRALRLYDYCSPSQGGRFVTYLKITLYHNALNNLLPMRSGELSFPVFMQRYFATPPAFALTTLLWLRLLDLYVIALIASAAAGIAAGATAYALPAVLLLLPLPLLIPRLHHRLRAALAARGGYLADTCRRALQGLPAGRAALWRSLLWSWLSWLVKIAVLAQVLRHFLPQSTPGVAWLGAIGGDLTSVLPVHAPGGFGTYEAGVVAAIAAWVPDPLASGLAALNLHLFVLAGSLIGAGAAMLLPAARPRGG